MHIGMEEVVAQRMPQEGLDQRVGEHIEVMAGPPSALDIGHLDAVDPLHGDDVAAGALPIDFGDPEAGILLGVFRYFESAAASRRRSISTLVVCSNVRVTSTGLRRRLDGIKRSCRWATRYIALISLPKRCRTPGRTTLTATRLRPCACRTSAGCTCAIEAAAIGSSKLTVKVVDGGGQANLRSQPLPPHAGRKPCGPAVATGRWPCRRRRHRVASPGTGRSSRRKARAASTALARRPPRARLLARLRAKMLTKRFGQADGGRQSFGRSAMTTPSRTSTQPTLRRPKYTPKALIGSQGLA